MQLALRGGLAVVVFAGWSSTIGCTVGDLNPASQESEDGYRAVGALVAEGTAFCSATLVGPRTVLTAGHCVSGNLAPGVSFFLGADLNGGGEHIEVVALHPHPDHSLSESSNIGIALLAEPAPTEAIEFARDVPESLLGTDVRLVGYMDQSLSRYDATKQRVDLPLTKLGERSFRVAADAPEKDCETLLGGPVMATIEGREVMVGVTSDGNQFCRAEALSTRIDAHPDFLSRFELDAANVEDDCAEFEFYGDGVCDDFCVLPDPDCADGGGDICEEYGWYGDGVCDSFCPQPDVQDCAGAEEPSETGDICADNGWYGDLECDTFCPEPDPDCV